MDREYFFNLLKEKLGNKNLIKHCLAVEACLIGLAEYFKEDKEVWGMAGLLHDWDYCGEIDPKDHGLIAEKELSSLGVSSEITQAIKAHNEENGTERKSLLDKAIFSADPTTGLIVASVLVLPSGKIEDLDLSMLMKRFKEKRFAAGARREVISACSDLDLDLEKFFEICLKSMKRISKDLGL